MSEQNMSMNQHHLILGGMRSGKSVYAENLVLDAGKNPVYIATGQAFDKEMEKRIETHKQRRGKLWICCETPLDIVASLKQYDSSENVILLDCLTMWLNNMMAEGRDIALETEKMGTYLKKMTCPVVFVSNEVGLGIIPDNKLARQFADAQGLLNQRLAAICSNVTLVTAGLPLQLKANS